MKSYDSFGLLIRKLLSVKKNKKIIFVRHAQSTGNLDNLLYGKLDLPLTEKGINDTKNLKTKLHGCYDLIDNIYSSDWIRAQQTANILLPNNEIKIKKEFSEINLGGLEGMAVHNIPQNHRNYFFNNIILNGKLTGNGLEPIQDIENRLIKGLSELDNGVNMVFSHFGIIYTLIKMINKNKIDNENFMLENLAVYAFAFNDNFENVDEIGLYEFLKK